MKREIEKIPEETRLTVRLPRASTEDLEKIKMRLRTSSDNEAVRRLITLGILCITEGARVSITDDRGTRIIEFI